MIKNVAIIGATGMLGRPVTGVFLQSKFNVTILARNLETAGQYFPSATVLPVDLRDKKSLQRGLINQDAIYLNLHVTSFEKPGDFHAETDGLQNLLFAVRNFSIEKIGLLSSLVHRYQGMNNFNWWVFDVKRQAVELIKNSGIPYCIFYSSSFMENFDHAYRRGRAINLVGRAQYPQHWIAGEDYGHQVVRAFESKFVNREYPIQGPQALFPEQAARIFIKHYTREKLTVRRSPMALLKFIGLFNANLNYVWHYMEALNKYPEKFEAKQTWKELGIPETTIDMYAKQLS
ncbi:NAD(P)H-binding protein [candidate division KSB1 bacterium]|nr:NAD(P)H-binding protein [candidate division KSB1 bacterium]